MWETDATNCLLLLYRKYGGTRPAVHQPHLEQQGRNHFPTAAVCVREDTTRPSSRGSKCNHKCNHSSAGHHYYSLHDYQNMPHTTSTRSIHSIIFPSPDASPIEITAQSQVVISLFPEMTWCVAPPVAILSVTGPPYANGTANFTTSIEGTGSFETKARSLSPESLSSCLNIFRYSSALVVCIASLRICRRVQRGRLPHLRKC